MIEAVTASERALSLPLAADRPGLALLVETFDPRHASASRRPA